MQIPKLQVCFTVLEKEFKILIDKMSKSENRREKQFTYNKECLIVFIQLWLCSLFLSIF